MRVLAIHSQEAVVRTIRKQLEESGWDVTGMTSAVGAMLTCRQEAYDLVICGFDLPVVSCIELVRTLRNYSVNKSTPVVILCDGSESAAQRELATRLQARLLRASQLNDALNEIMSPHEDEL
ncbi:MAG: response regulator [Cyclobacteriaceae bacterium]|nr:response regulator [Cyclobacteriaceae bacterium]